MQDATERRKTPRGLHEEVLISKAICSSDPDINPGRTFVSKTADISMQGLRIRLNHEPAVGSTMELWIISHHHQGTLVLTGTVRWARPVSSDGFTFQAGIELSQDPAEDYAKWQEIIADLIPRGM